jgi:CRP/FNR family transcriptional regulator
VGGIAQAVRPEYLELWRQASFLSSVPLPVVEALAAAATPRRAAAGEIVFLEGDPVAGLYLIESGAVRISRFSKEGREYTLHMLGRGDTFNDVAALDGGPNPASAMAHTDALLWRVARDDLRRLAVQHPELAWALIENIAGRARHLVDVVQNLAMRNVRGRLARLLLDQAEAAERGESPTLMTQEEMANQLGTVREVVGRALRSLAADGVLQVDRHRIVITDRVRLMAATEI